MTWPLWCDWCDQPAKQAYSPWARNYPDRLTICFKCAGKLSRLVLMVDRETRTV